MAAAHAANPSSSSTGGANAGMTLTVSEVIKIVKDTSKDETVLKYLTRFRQKLKQPLQPE